MVRANLNPLDAAGNHALLVKLLTDREAAGLQGRPGTVLLNAGEFPIGGVVRLAAGQRVVGSGSVNGTQLQLGGTTLFSISSGANGAELEHIELVAIGGPSGVGVHVPRGARNLRLKDVSIRGFSAGVRVHAKADTSFVVIEHCVFEDCTVGLDANPGGSARRQMFRIMASAFEFRSAEDSVRGIHFEGDCLEVTGCRFTVRDNGERARWRPVEFRGRSGQIRYNVFDGAAPHIRTSSTTPASAGVVVEHNVHLNTGGGLTVHSLDGAGVRRGGGQGCRVVGEGVRNLLRNGSFEWWDHYEQGALPVGWRFSANVRPHRIAPGLDGRVLVQYPPPQRGRPPLEGLVEPGSRDGSVACQFKVVAEEGRFGQVAADPYILDEPGPYTFSCWVRVESPEARPTVALVLQIDGLDERISIGRPYAFGPIAEWQLLTCSIVALPLERELTASILTFSVETISVAVDGAKLNRGHLATEPGTSPVTDVGGEIVGAVDFGGEGALVTAHIRLIPPGFIESPGIISRAVDSLLVPMDCHLVAVEVGAASVGRVVATDTRDGRRVFDSGAFAETHLARVANEAVAARTIIRIDAFGPGLSAIDVTLQFRARTLAHPHRIDRLALGFQR